MQKFVLALLSVLATFSCASANLVVSSTTATTSSVMVFDDATNNRQQLLSFSAPEYLLQQGDVMVELMSNSTLAFDNCKFTLTNAQRTAGVNVVGNFPASSTEDLSAFYRYTVKGSTSDEQKLVFKRVVAQSSSNEATMCSFLGDDKFHAFDGVQVYQNKVANEAIDIVRTTDFLVQASFDKCRDPAETSPNCINTIAFQSSSGAYGVVDLEKQSFSNGISVTNEAAGFSFTYNGVQVVVTKNTFANDQSKVGSLGITVKLPTKYINRTDGICQVYNNMNEVDVNMPARSSECIITNGEYNADCKFVSDYKLPENFYTCNSFEILDSPAATSSSSLVVSPTVEVTQTTETKQPEATSTEVVATDSSNSTPTVSETASIETLSDETITTSVAQPTTTDVAQQTSTENSVATTSIVPQPSSPPPSTPVTTNIFMIEIKGLVFINANIEACVAAVSELKKAEQYGVNLGTNLDGLEKLCSCRIHETKNTKTVENVYAVAKTVVKTEAKKCASSPTASDAAKKNAQKDLDNYKTEESSGKKVNKKIDDLIKQFVEAISPANAVTASLAAIVMAQLAALAF